MYCFNAQRNDQLESLCGSVRKTLLSESDSLTRFIYVHAFIKIKLLPCNGPACHENPL
jgi:hypothetical protein